MFFDFSNPKRTYENVAVIGAGTLGSALIYLLAKKRIARNILIIDDDQVESKNTTNQIYDPEDVGKKKGDVLKKKLERYVKIEWLDSKVTPYNMKILDNYEIVIDTTDSLYVIKEILPFISPSIFGSLKIRGTEGMITLVTSERKQKFLEIIKDKEESIDLRELPVRLESSFLLASLFIHALSYSLQFNRIFFINLKNISCAAEIIKF